MFTECVLELIWSLKVLGISGAAHEREALRAESPLVSTAALRAFEQRQIIHSRSASLLTSMDQVSCILFKTYASADFVFLSVSNW